MSFKAAFEAPCNYCNGDHSVEACRSLPNNVLPEIPDELLEYWQERSDLFAPPNVIHDGGIE
jgi:hypothetical protein